jgi:prepilin-type processing-associated H-X9-DG protein
MLFESKPGWNQVGGPELLWTDNHGGKGCNILFGDEHVECVECKQLAKLKWKPD